MEKRTEWGQTVVHDEVLAAVASRAAMSVPGVVEMSHHGLGDNLHNLVRHDPMGRGVRVGQLPDGHYAIDIYVVAQYGVRFGSLGRQIAERVNEALKMAVERYPDALTIHIEGVRVVGE